MTKVKQISVSKTNDPNSEYLQVDIRIEDCSELLQNSVVSKLTSDLVSEDTSCVSYFRDYVSKVSVLTTKEFDRLSNKIKVLTVFALYTQKTREQIDATITEISNLALKT